MFILNLSQLAKVTDIGVYSLYPNMKKYKRNPNKNYNIDLDHYLINCKVNNFKFIYEIKGTSFSDRLIKKEIKYKYITAKEVKSMLNIPYYKLAALRKNEKIEAVNINKTRYRYYGKSVIKYIDNINEFKIYEYSKQFYTSSETLKELNKYGIKISLKTLYRYIYDYQKIPCIKIYGSLRVPILEFQEQVIPYIETIFERYINNK